MINLTLPSFNKKTIRFVCSASMLAISPVLSSYAASTPWAVRDIVDPASPKKGYCVASKTYGNNILMTLARNANEDLSMAFDYQANVFDPARTMTVKLKIGDIERI